MSLQDSNRTSFRYTRETAWRLPSIAAAAIAAGTLGTIGLFEIPFTGVTLDHNKGTAESEEIHSDRMVTDVIALGVDVAGVSNHELKNTEFDDFWSAVMCSDYNLILSATCTVSAQTITADSGTPFGPLIGAKFIKLANCATVGNNGIKKVVSITATVITLAAGSLSGSDAADVMDFYLNEHSAIDSVTVTVTGTGTIYTATVGTFSTITQGARYVKLAGGTLSANSAGIRKVVSCTSTVLTLEAPTTGTDEVGKTATVTARYTRPGTTVHTHILQEHFLDAGTAGEYLAYSGCMIDKMDVKNAARSKLMLALSWMGYSGYSRTAALNTETVTTTGSFTNPVTSSSNNIGTVLVDGAAAVNPVKSADFQINNNLRTRPVVGDQGTLQLGSGDSSITGQMDVYFADGAILRKFLAHTTSSLEEKCTDSLGNVIGFYFPRIHFLKGTPGIPKLNDDVMQSLPFKAIKHSTLGYHLQIDRLTA